MLGYHFKISTTPEYMERSFGKKMFFMQMPISWKYSNLLSFGGNAPYPFSNLPLLSGEKKKFIAGINDHNTRTITKQEFANL